MEKGKNLNKNVSSYRIRRAESFVGPGANETNEAPDDVIMKLQAENKKTVPPPQKREIYLFSQKFAIWIRNVKCNQNDDICKQLQNIITFWGQSKSYIFNVNLSFNLLSYVID